MPRPTIACDICFMLYDRLWSLLDVKKQQQGVKIITLLSCALLSGSQVTYHSYATFSPAEILQATAPLQRSHLIFSFWGKFKQK